jgi:hypothetical protein
VELVVTDDLANIADWHIVRGWGKVNRKYTIACDGVGVGNNHIDCVIVRLVNGHVAAK